MFNFDSFFPFILCDVKTKIHRTYCAAYWWEWNDTRHIVLRIDSHSALMLLPYKHHFMTLLCTNLPHSLLFHSNKRVRVVTRVEMQIKSCWRQWNTMYCSNQYSLAIKLLHELKCRTKVGDDSDILCIVIKQYSRVSTHTNLI